MASGRGIYTAEVAPDFWRLKVPEIKKYLQERGISVSDYRKDQLVRLGQVAHEIKLPVLSVPDDHSKTLQDRLTVLIQNVEVILPRVDEVVDWVVDLSCLPVIELSDVFVYPGSATKMTSFAEKVPATAVHCGRK